MPEKFTKDPWFVVAAVCGVLFVIIIPTRPTPTCIYPSPPDQIGLSLNLNNPKPMNHTQDKLQFTTVHIKV